MKEKGFLRLHSSLSLKDFSFSISILETVPKKSEKMLSKNLLETKSIIFSERFKVYLKQFGFKSSVYWSYIRLIKK
jgi:hypothetical protein